MEIEKKPELQVVKPANSQNAPMEANVQKIGAEQLQSFTKILEEYKAGKVQTEQRILASENWWKLRNSIEEQKDSKTMADEGFKAVSGWLHNVIVSKHADCIRSYPEPNILARESGDKTRHRCSLPLFLAYWSRTILNLPTPMPCGRS